ALASGWSNKGSNEPSTSYDSTGVYMFADKNVDPTKEKVYFNAFEDVSNPVVRTTLSPNLGTLGMAHRMTPHSNMAMLGTWLDCNKDGYIGLGDHGLLEYRAELINTLGASNPLGGNVCPVKPMPTTWGGSITHHDGAWIHEFAPS